MDITQASKWVPHLSKCIEVKRRRSSTYGKIVSLYEQQHGTPASKLEMLVICNWYPYRYTAAAVLPSVSSELAYLQIDEDGVGALDVFEQWGGDRNDRYGLNGTPAEVLDGTRLQDLRTGTPRPPLPTDKVWTAYSQPVEYSHAYLRILQWHGDSVLVKIGHSTRSVVARYMQAVTRSDSGSVQTVPFLDVRGVVSGAQRADIAAWMASQTTCDDLPESGRAYFRHQALDPHWLELALLYTGQQFHTILPTAGHTFALRGRCEFLLMPVATFDEFVARCTQNHQLGGMLYRSPENEFVLGRGDAVYNSFATSCLDR
jgi:hypothetical protein